MIQKIINFLNSIPPKDVRTLQALLDSSVTVTDRIQVDPVTSEDFRSLLRATLDQSVAAATANSVQCTAALNILGYDYTYLVINTGGTNTALAYLQASPDGTTWETQSATKSITPGTVVSFVPNVIAKYSRLCYQSQLSGNSTTLTIYIQGRS